MESSLTSFLLRSSFSLIIFFAVQVVQFELYKRN